MSTLVREVPSVAPADRAGERSPKVSLRLRLFHLLRGWRRRAAARRELSRLNDNFLWDIGMSRADVDPRAAYSFQDRATWSRRLLP